jgi:FkbM family methyltransferase
VFKLENKSGGSVISCLAKICEQSGIHPNIVDVGARSGMFLIPPEYAAIADYYGFEPNPVEYHKLLKKQTDAMKSGVVMPKFRSETYYECAMWNSTGFHDFYVTAGPGACNLMGRSEKRITEKIYLDVNEKSYEEAHSAIQETLSVKIDRLDNTIAVDKIDFLKIDAEGGDHFVLEGAQKLLENKQVLCAKTEVQLFPIFERDNPLLAEQQILMRDYGYRLIGIDLDHSGYTYGASKVKKRYDRRPLYGGDAIFVVDFDLHDLCEKDTFRLGVVCFILGFHSLAEHLFGKLELLNPNLPNILSEAQVRESRKRKLLNYWNEVPYVVDDWLAKIGLGR